MMLTAGVKMPYYIINKLLSSVLLFMNKAEEKLATTDPNTIFYGNVFILSFTSKKDQ